jgi:hypothetical protein
MMFGGHPSVKAHLSVSTPVSSGRLGFGPEETAGTGQEARQVTLLGTVLDVVQLPVNPKLAVAPGFSAPFQDTSLMLTAAPDWLGLPFPGWLITCPFGNVQVTVHPLVCRCCQWLHELVGRLGTVQGDPVKEPFAHTRGRPGRRRQVHVQRFDGGRLAPRAHQRRDCQ